MTTHTPGPWHFDRHGYALYVNSGDTLVTALSMDGKRLETSEADARLIASAPEMLAVLQDLAAYFGPTPDVDNGLDEILTAARAAIAAATREAQP